MMVGTGTRHRDLLPMELSAAAFRAAMGRFPTGVTLLTHGSAETLEVMTASSFISVSLEPLLVLVSVRTTSRMRPHLDSGGGYAVQVLGEDQRYAAELFSRRDRPSGREAERVLGAVVSPSGNALVPGAVACFECALYGRHLAGDHVLFIGQVIAMHVAPHPRSPLLVHQGHYGAPR